LCLFCSFIVFCISIRLRCISEEIVFLSFWPVLVHTKQWYTVKEGFISKPNQTYGGAIKLCGYAFHMRQPNLPTKLTVLQLYHFNYVQIGNKEQPATITKLPSENMTNIILHCILERGAQNRRWKVEKLYIVAISVVRN